MKMVRHQNKLVEQISASITVVEQSLDENLRSLSNLEYTPAVPTLRGHKIGASRSSSMFRGGHSLTFFRG